MQKQISILILIVTCSCLAFTKFNNKALNENDSKPNVILIVTDDQGYNDVGFNGCKDIPTPNIDKIAGNGVTFTNGYVSYSVCAPSRAGLLTGRYQDRFGYSRNPLYKPLDSTIGIPLSEQMLPEYLLQCNYKTMAIGKWHLGVHNKFKPHNRGFNDFFGFWGGGHVYFPEQLTLNGDSVHNEDKSYKTKLVRNTTAVEEKEYLTDAFSREAVSFIQKNKSNPFFLYLAYNAPHTPMQASEKYLSRFEHIKNEKRRTYSAMVSAVDDGVGKILETLENLKLDKNTIVIFLSDNGGPKNDNASNNDPLRGGKSSLFEGGIRVPFAMQWPAKIKKGLVYDKPVISLDIFATIASNIKNSPKTKNNLDGVNLLPFLEKKNKQIPHEFLFWRKFDSKDYAVVHQSGFKQVISKDSIINLYNLKIDLGEKTNLNLQNNDMLQLLDVQRKKWLEQTVSPIFYGLNQESLYNSMMKNK